MKCILHVGAHKTGTSAIQMALAGYDDGSTLYADLGDPNHSIPIQTLFSEDHLWAHWKRMGLSEQEHTALIKDLNRKFSGNFENRHDRVVFSGENISILDISSLKRLRVALEERGADIEIIMFVRDPLAYRVSIAAELVKQGETDVLADHLMSIRQRYHNLLSVFGKRPAVIKYEEIEFFNNNIVEVFSDYVGIDASRLANSSLRSNSSLTEDAFKIVLKFNKLGITHNKGKVLSEARWAFVRGVVELLSSKRPLNKKYFVQLVNPAELEFLSQLLGLGYGKYEDLENGEDFDSYLNDISEQAVVDISQFLCAKGLAYDYKSDVDAMISILFYYFVAEEFQRSGVLREVG
ncbi:MAG: hypothetical protein ACK2UO_15075 [Caldilineaceae bacterium]